MLISAGWIWLIAAAVLCGAELLSGTFYLLVLGVGCVFASLAAWCSLPPAWQFVVFAVVAAAAGVAVYRMKKSRASELDAVQNPDVGQSVFVESWNSDGSATVTYRGALWRAVNKDGPAACSNATRYRIDRVDGTRLVLAAE